MSGQRPACPRPIDSVSLARPCTSSAGRALYEPEQEETLSGIRGWMLIAVVILCLTVSSGIGATDPPVILGANSIEYAGGDPPNCFGPSILFDYGVRDIRPRVRNQLAAMAAAGMKSLRPGAAGSRSRSEPTLLTISATFALQVFAGSRWRSTPASQWIPPLGTALTIRRRSRRRGGSFAIRARCSSSTGRQTPVSTY